MSLFYYFDTCPHKCSLTPVFILGPLCRHDTRKALVVGRPKPESGAVGVVSVHRLIRDSLRRHCIAPIYRAIQTTHPREAAIHMHACMHA